MFTFQNVGFTHTFDGNKYLACADCEAGPIGFHDVENKASYVALSRVCHGWIVSFAIYVTECNMFLYYPVFFICHFRAIFCVYIVVEKYIRVMLSAISYGELLHNMGFSLRCV